MCLAGHIAQKMKLSIKYFFSKCDHILSKVQILLKKSLMGNFIFRAVSVFKLKYSRASTNRGF